MKILNWLIKQWFYWLYLRKEQGNWIMPLVDDPTFESYAFADGKWNPHLPWNAEKDKWDYNTYGKFWKRYGKFYFNCKLDGEIIHDVSRPAIWLLEIRDEDDVNPNLMGFSGCNYYYEIDIELFHDSLKYTIHINHNGKQHDKATGYHCMNCKFENKKLYQDLREYYHVYCIDWQWDYIRFYIDGLLTAKFKNEIHLPMQIVLSKLDMSEVIVTK